MEVSVWLFIIDIDQNYIYLQNLIDNIIRDIYEK